MSNKKNRKEDTKKPETFIYCGPTLKDGILQQNSVFRGELPQHIVNIREKHPVISELFVSTTVFAHVSKNIKIQGTREHQLFQQAVKVAQGGSN